MKKQGLPAYVLHSVNPTPNNSGDYYRVRVGYFPTRDEAVAFGNYHKEKNNWGFWVDRRSSSGTVLSSKPPVKKVKPVKNIVLKKKENLPEKMVLKTPKVEKPVVKKVKKVVQSQKKKVTTASKPAISVLEKAVSSSNVAKTTASVSGGMTDEWGDDGDGWASDTTDW